jgi:hypothetical protein
MRGSQNSSLEAVMEGDGFRLMVTHLRMQAQTSQALAKPLRTPCHTIVLEIDSEQLRRKSSHHD